MLGIGQFTIGVCLNMDAMMLSGKAKDAIKLVEKWVFETCGPEYGEHHGFQHAQTVSELAEIIYNEMVLAKQASPNLLTLILVVAWLHDVGDSKIDKDGSKQKALESFLGEHFPESKKLILDIIDRISHSKELKMRKEMNGDVDWLQVLGESGTLVRNIVSDADKLESLGITGHCRSKQFNKHRLALTDSREDQLKLFAAVDEIIEQKLKALRSYVYTEPGKRMSVLRTKELLAIHEKWRQELFG